MSHSPSLATRPAGRGSASRSWFGYWHKIKLHSRRGGVRRTVGYWDRVESVVGRAAMSNGGLRLWEVVVAGVSIWPVRCVW